MPESMNNAVQIAIYNALSASAGLTALLADRIDSPGSPAVYDTVPQPSDSGDNGIFPYVIIGDDDISNWSTDTATGGEVRATVHSWSRAQNKRESKRILGEIKLALHRQELVVPDHEFIGCEMDSSGPVVLDPDMETYHGTIIFTLWIDQLGFGDG